MSSSTNTAVTILLQLVPGTPVYLVYVVTLYLALSRWKRHPRASSLAFAGALVMLLGSLSSTVLWILMIQRMSIARASGLFTLHSVGFGLLHTAGLALLVASVFVGRDSSVAGAFPVGRLSDAPLPGPVGPLQPGG
jgi:hypothetical protein